MAKITNHNEMRYRLKQNAIRIVASEGIEHLTTKKVAQASDLAEVYIYRYFESKTDLLDQCFMEVEKMIGDNLTDIFEAVIQKNMNLDDSAEEFWYMFWKFLMQHPECTIFYKRFYNSAYFNQELRDVRRYDFEKLVQKIYRLGERYNVLSESDLDVEMVLKHIIDVTVSYAVKILSEEMPNDEDNIRFIYHMIITPLLYG